MGLADQVRDVFNQPADEALWEAESKEMDPFSTVLAAIVAQNRGIGEALILIAGALDQD